MAQKRQMRQVWVLVLVALACTKKDVDPSQGPGEPQAAVAGAGAGAEDSAVVPPTPTPDGFVTGGTAYVTQLVTVRREPSDAKELGDSKAHGKKVANWLATLYRGEQVTVQALQGPYLQVQLSDGKSGWTRSEGLLTGQGVEMVTLLDRAKTFSRPDLLALLAGKQVEPGSLLLLVRGKDAFSEVNVSGSSSVWILSDLIVREPREVEAAKLVQRARVLQDRNASDAAAILDMAKTQFANTRLVQQVLMPPPPPPPVDPNALPEPVPAPGIAPTAPEAALAPAAPPGFAPAVPTD